MDISVIVVVAGLFVIACLFMARLMTRRPGRQATSTPSPTLIGAFITWLRELHDFTPSADATNSEISACKRYRNNAALRNVIEPADFRSIVTDPHDRLLLVILFARALGDPEQISESDRTYLVHG